MPARKSPARPLAPRNCPSCGELWTPYRETDRACSRLCYTRLPDVRAKSAALKARPEAARRRNEMRRVAVGGDKRRRENLARNLSQYGMTIDDYEWMLGQQDGKCAICGSPPDPNGVKAASRLHVDHCHTGKFVRKLLCNRCNMGVGYMRDDPDLLRAAADYIEAHQLT